MAHRTLVAGVAGMRLLQAALHNPGHLSSIIGASILWSKMLKGVDQVPAIFAEFAHVTLPTQRLATTDRHFGAPHLAASGAPVQQRRVAASPASHGAADFKTAMLALVTEVVTSMLGSDVALNQPLMEAGLDSLGKYALGGLQARAATKFQLKGEHIMNLCRCRRTSPHSPVKVGL